MQRTRRSFGRMMGIFALIVFSLIMQPWHVAVASADEKPTRIETDLLIVGGSEGACAAAVQAARMGVGSITLVNDIAWLGGQFSAEALIAIDESTNTTGLKPGVRHELPIPRNGLFKEVITRIETLNKQKYGRRRPGNTRVITTCRPADAEQVFRELLEPYVKSGQLKIVNHYYPTAATLAADGKTLREVRFQSITNDQPALTVNARLTVDASDWGEVIKLSGADYEFGPDLKSKYNEPEAPTSRYEYPLTDMNSITYVMVIVETDELATITPPPGYDRRVFDRNPYPKYHEYFYTSRRAIDHYNYADVTHPDVILLCTPIQDYPLDVLPRQVVEALEADEPGSSKKNIIEMTRQQREIIFEDAKLQSLGLLHWMQTVLDEQLEDKTHSFRRFRLTDEFGTPDRMPWKPYQRESLRLKAMYMMKQQDTWGHEGKSQNFARARYHDSVASWQFENDFHPTRREFIDRDLAGTAGKEQNPTSGTLWLPKFRKLRNWGPPYSGRATFPLRSLVPEKIDGLLGGAKNLGFSSIVSAAIRLHDSIMAVGQAAGATAAVAIRNNIPPRSIPYDLALLDQVQRSLCSREQGAEPALLCPYRDVQTEHPAFEAINMMGVRQLLPIARTDISFGPDEPATDAWKQAVISRSLKAIVADQIPNPLKNATTRGEFVRGWWEEIKDFPIRRPATQPSDDFDGDGLKNKVDALPYDADNDNVMDHVVTGHVDD